jgi:Domain of unknown function (DUF6531)
VPSGALKWSGTFTWQVRVSHQIGWGAWSYPSSLNPAIVQPTITSHLGATNGTKGYDPLTGNYTAHATDANLSAIGPALTVQRTYNSLDPRVGQAFGSGWSSVLDSQAAVDSDNSGNVVATFANGQQVRFGKNGDGSFSPPSGMYATLSAAKTTEPAGSYCPSASTGYCLLDKTGVFPLSKTRLAHARFSSAGVAAKTRCSTNPDSTAWTARIIWNRVIPPSPRASNIGTVHLSNSARASVWVLWSQPWPTDCAGSQIGEVQTSQTIWSAAS